MDKNIKFLGDYLGKVSQYIPKKGGLFEGGYFEVYAKLIVGVGFLPCPPLLIRFIEKTGHAFEIGDKLPSFSVKLEDSLPNPGCEIVMSAWESEGIMFTNSWGYYDQFLEIKDLMLKMPFYRLLAYNDNKMKPIITSRNINSLIDKISSFWDMMPPFVRLGLKPSKVFALQIAENNGEARPRWKNVPIEETKYLLNID